MKDLRAINEVINTWIWGSCMMLAFFIIVVSSHPAADRGLFITQFCVFLCVLYCPHTKWCLTKQRLSTKECAFDLMLQPFVCSLHQLTCMGARLTPTCCVWAAFECSPTFHAMTDWAVWDERAGMQISKCSRLWQYSHLTWKCCCLPQGTDARGEEDVATECSLYTFFDQHSMSTTVFFLHDNGFFRLHL